MTASTGYLLDSHVLLWWWFDPQRMPEGVLALLSNLETPIVVSSASVWELSIKHQQGKLLAA
jgi:PIN domain nuclease of toxin-antitoxin system